MFRVNNLEWIQTLFLSPIIDKLRDNLLFNISVEKSASMLCEIENASLIKRQEFAFISG